MEAGRALLERSPGYQEPDLSPAAAKRTAAIFGEPLTVVQAVRRVLDEVRRDGDDAVRSFARRIDGREPESIEVPPDRWEEAVRALPSEQMDALRTAAGRIRAYHEASMPRGWSDDAAGYGEAVVPIQRVGLYVPGGTAEYPSTVLMTALPAKVAGVPEVVMCTPSPSTAALAAASLAGVDRVFEIGGAQAIGAMAFGTATVPRVDKICGPGSVFVSVAKREVYGHVDIDGLYGPTETVVIADDSTDPVLAAADLLAQAEHDEMATPILVATDATTAERITTRSTVSSGLSNAAPSRARPSKGRGSRSSSTAWTRPSNWRTRLPRSTCACSYATRAPMSAPCGTRAGYSWDTSRPR